MDTLEMFKHFTWLNIGLVENWFGGRRVECSGTCDTIKQWVIYTHRNQSTAMIIEMSLVGKLRAVSTSNIVTRPAEGTDAAPIEAAVEVNDTITIWPRLNSTAFICAMNIAATASYRAVPSMLTVAPTGSTNLVTWKSKQNELLKGNFMRLCLRLGKSSGYWGGLTRSIAFWSYSDCW